MVSPIVVALRLLLGFIMFTHSLIVEKRVGCRVFPRSRFSRRSVIRELRNDGAWDLIS
jgi:hypothetical protein